MDSAKETDSLVHGSWKKREKRVQGGELRLGKVPIMSIRKHVPHMLATVRHDGKRFACGEKRGTQQGMGLSLTRPGHASDHHLGSTEKRPKEEEG